MNSLVTGSLSACCLTVVGAAQSSYHVVPLGTLPQQVGSVPSDINALGDVTGWAQMPFNRNRAFVYTDAGGIVDIGLPFNNVAARGLGINDLGQVTGESSADGFVWTPGQGFTQLPSLGSGPAAFTEGQDINDGGVVCGASGSLNIGGTVNPFRWTSASGISALTSGSGGGAFDVNEAGQIVGYSSVSGWRFTPGTGTVFLPALPGLPLTFAKAVNDQGEVAGNMKSANGFTNHLFLFTDAGGMQDLGTLGGSDGAVWGIANDGTIVGEADFASDFAFRWTSAGGMQDLNALIPANSGWHLVSARGINEAGQIVCVANNPAFPDQAAVRLDPIVPASSVPVGSGCGATAGGPVLASAPPVLGQSASITVTNGAPSAAGVLAVSFGAAMPFALGQGCTVFVDLPRSFVVLAVLTDATGSWHGSLALPRVPWVTGTTLTTQAGLASTAGPLGVDLSNGLEWTFGY